MKPSLLLVSITLGFAVILSSCATSASNDKLAVCEGSTDGYKIVLRGTRDNMSHSFLMYLAQPSLKASLELLVPRIAGTVTGKEVTSAQQPGRVFDGSMKFANGTVEVALFYPGGNPPVALDWNGNYQLSPCHPQ